MPTAAPPQPSAVDSAGAMPVCTPETLYTFVVGRAPGPELGYPIDRGGDAHGQVAATILPEDPMTLVDPHASTADDPDIGASTRAKKRRKVQRRAKVSEIWFPRAEMAFCTCVTAIPPNGRTKIKFFGRPLGRNELIAAICTLATHRLYNRKQISSHSQVLKDKVPGQFKEIFTFEDKSRGTDDPAESSTANVIENYQFPDIIYSIINYPLGTDLANAPKPAWLIDLEAGVGDAQAPPMDPSTPRAYNNYWSNNPSADYSSYYGRASSGGYPKNSKDRDGRPMPGGDPYYQYSPQAQARQSGPYPPPHTLPPLPMGRDVDPAGADASRFSFAPPPPQSGMASRGRTGNGTWDEYARSPTSTSSYDAQQSSQSSVSPRQSTTGAPLSSAELTLPPLQEVPSPTYTDWKDRALYPDTKWGAPSGAPVQSAVRSGIPALSSLPSFGSVASQSAGYGQSGGGGGGGGWSDPYGWDSTSAIRTSRNNSLPLGPFIPLAIEVKADTGSSTVSLTSSEPLVNEMPCSLDAVIFWETRYPFLGSMGQGSGVTVYHVEVPVIIPPNNTQRPFIIDSVADIGVDLVMRSLSDPTGWAITTDAAWFGTYGLNRLPRVVTPLRPLGNNGTSGEVSGTIRLPRLANLYDIILQGLRTTDYTASLADVGLPNTNIVQRIVRDNSDETRGPLEPELLPPMGADWASAACIIVYSLSMADAMSPPVITCREIDFSARFEPSVSDQHIAAHIMASEEQKSSTYDWMAPTR